MKINNFALAAFALGGMAAFSACDNIDADDRYNEIEKPVVPVEEVTKTLLIQEFSGNMCTNCPRGAEALHNIQEAYPGEVIVVGLHPEGGGPNTVPIGTQDFRTEAAQAMYNIYQPSGFPCAVFNGLKSSQSTAYDQWYTIASGLIGEIANMSIKADCDYDDATRKLTVDYSVTMTHDISNKDGYGIMVWIMENDIIGFQLDNGTMRSDYVHNHVLRASLNGDRGQIIGNAFKSGDIHRGSASMTLDANWKAENCQVVVYMFDAETYATEQSVLADVISEKVVEDPHKVPQTLLIQEFSGNMCTNCPRGAEALHSVDAAYPGQVVIVGLHPEGGGPNTVPIGTQDFRCEEAQVIYEFFRPSGFPCALFNGQDPSTAYDQWFTLATKALESETNMTINASTSFDSASREVSVDYFIDFTEDVAEDLNVMVWVMENGIIGFQLDNGTMRSDYEHNHVLRASLNGDWGENMGSTFSNGQTVKGTASMILDESWVAKNCQIVVYTFNEKTKVVRQATVTNINVPESE